MRAPASDSRFTSIRPARSGAGGVSESTGIPRSDSSLRNPGFAGQLTEVTTKEGDVPASISSRVAKVATPHRSAKAGRFSGLRTTMPVTSKRSGIALTMRR